MSGARNQSVELLRIVACVGILGLHARAPGWSLCYAGLVVFLVLLAHFEARSQSPPNLGRLAHRLLVPWAIAWIGFGFLDILRHQPVVRGNAILGLLYGASPHLWFLPFAFVAHVAIGVTKRFPIQLFVAATLVGGAAFWAVRYVAPAPPLYQYLCALGPVCVGVILALGRTRPALLFAPAAALLLLFAARAGGFAAPYVIGIGCSIGALAVPTRFDVTAVSRHMYGVYLVHPVFLSAAHLAHFTGWLAVPPAFCASLVAVVAWDAAWRRRALIFAACGGAVPTGLAGPDAHHRLAPQVPTEKDRDRAGRRDRPVSQIPDEA